MRSNRGEETTAERVDTLLALQLPKVVADKGSAVAGPYFSYAFRTSCYRHVRMTRNDSGGRTTKLLRKV